MLPPAHRRGTRDDITAAADAMVYVRSERVIVMGGGGGGGRAGEGTRQATGMFEV